MNVFWFVTMYDGKTQLLIENPINRYLINSPFAHVVHPEGFAWLRQGIKLAARAGRTDLSCDAPVPAKDRAAFHPAAGRRELAAAGGSAHRAADLLSRDILDQ